ncbi:hypothetical protein [Roseomonas sp. BN140053]|uniref:hypothetical protein n=1 Tax=Roseomonas sp. BN140053 TaxID=3391898 RepID=UPI0039E771F4
MSDHLGWASVTAPPEADLPAIAAAAGGTQRLRYEGGQLYVEGVEQAALDAALDSVGTDPPSIASPVRTISPREFRLRFTPAERGAVTLAASRALEADDPTLQVFLDDLAASSVVELDHPDLAAGMDALVARELLSRARADEILE